MEYKHSICVMHTAVLHYSYMTYDIYVHIFRTTVSYIILRVPGSPYDHDKHILPVRKFVSYVHTMYSEYVVCRMFQSTSSVYRYDTTR